ncbi:DUF3280 domain-containing protein [Limobrevibacterium gyesilva]|nr:DUF3280 domain-containing protein [Limobrevibacterium gyesilva]
MDTGRRVFKSFGRPVGASAIPADAEGTFVTGGKRMRVVLCFVAAALLSTRSAPAELPKAAPVTAAVFDFELDDTSLQGQMQGPRKDEQARLSRLTSQLRDRLANSGQYVVVDVPSIAAAARRYNLRACGGCDIAFARQAGAQVAVIGWVQKVSNLVLNINVVMRDVATGRVVHAGSVDIRGNTDDSWARGLEYLVRNQLLSSPQ